MGQCTRNGTLRACNTANFAPPRLSEKRSDTMNIRSRLLQSKSHMFALGSAGASLGSAWVSPSPR